LSGYEIKLKSRREKEEVCRQEVQKMDLSEKEKRQRAKLLMDLEQNLEGFAFSVKTVMKSAQDGVLRGVFGTVAQLVNVKQEYAMAVETALGGSLQHIVVADEGAAKASIRLLAERKAGRATFLPLTSVKGNPLNEQGLSAYSGYISLASERVTYDPKYEGIVQSLLGRIVIVDDLDTATVISKKYGYKFRIVTLDGQQVNAGGSFTGGSASKNQGILSRKNESQRLEQEANATQTQKAEMQKKLSELSEQVHGLQAQIDGANSEMIVANEDYVRFSGECQHCKQSENHLLERMSQLESLRLQSCKKIDESKKRMEEAEKQIGILNCRNLEWKEELGHFQGSMDDVSQKREELSQALSAFSHRKIELEKDLEAATTALAELENRKKEAAENRQEQELQRESLRATIQMLKESINCRQTDANTFTVQIEEYDQKMKAAIEKRQQIEGETTRLRTKEREVSG
ncbi:MAG: hypothetical protein RR977_04100, partial [Oscillospiraceae bacterium]